MRKVKQIMGMPVILDIPNCSSKEIFNKIFGLFSDIDEKFSTYKKNSELSRYKRSELTDNEISTELKHIISACNSAEDRTHGYFSAYYKGEFDPIGYVKGWAISEAGKKLKGLGFKTFCIAAGGDMLASSDKTKDWKIGIENPSSLEYLTSKVILKNGAVATSGNYARGNHIYNPITGEIADELVSLTVIGPEIIEADVLATAGFAAGTSGLVLVEETPRYEALATLQNGDIYMTSGMEKLLQSD